jgi:hypothetical protein
MARKPGISHEARAKLMQELKELHTKSPDGSAVTRLSQGLGWKSTDTQKVVDDLVMSGMVYWDYLSPWALTHPNRPKTKLLKSGTYLLKVSPWGENS